LKSCPFCGGAASTWITDAYSCDSSERVLGCQDCDIQMPYGSVFNSEVIPEAYAAAWNTRADMSADLVRAALERAAEVSDHACKNMNDIGLKSPEDSDARSRCFARAREAIYIAQDIRAIAKDDEAVEAIIASVLGEPT